MRIGLRLIDSLKKTSLFNCAEFLILRFIMATATSMSCWLMILATCLTLLVVEFHACNKSAEPCLIESNDKQYCTSSSQNSHVISSAPFMQ